MGRRYPLSAGQAVDVWRPGVTHAGALVVNEGPGVVWLDTDPAPGTAPMPLSPGDSVPWDANRGLSLTADQLRATSVLVTDNSGQPSPATAIARAILEQGLAIDIASAISLAGVPAIDRPAVLLAPTTATVPRGVTWLSGSLDVSSYATCIVTLAARKSGTGTPAIPAQVTAELRWLAEDGVTVIATDRKSLWLDPAGSSQTWCLQAPAWGSRLQLAVTVPDTYGVVPATYPYAGVVIGASVVGSYRDRPAGCSVVTPAGAWAGGVSSTFRGHLSASATTLNSPAIPAGTAWRDAISPAWPGERLTLTVQAPGGPLADPVDLALLVVRADSVVDTVAAWPLAVGSSRWVLGFDTPPDVALLLQARPASGSPVLLEVETLWSKTPIGLPGTLLNV